MMKIATDALSNFPQMPSLNESLSLHARSAVQSAWRGRATERPRWLRWLCANREVRVPSTRDAPNTGQAWFMNARLDTTHLECMC